MQCQVKSNVVFYKNGITICNFLKERKKEGKLWVVTSHYIVVVISHAILQPEIITLLSSEKGQTFYLTFTHSCGGLQGSSL